MIADKFTKHIVRIIVATLIITSVIIPVSTFTPGITGDRSGSEVFAATLSFKITFNANGGKVSKKSKKVEVGQKFGTLPKPTRPGYKFLGWYTDKGSYGTKITAKSKVKSGWGKKLYAHWKSTAPTFVTKYFKMDYDDIKISEGGSLTRIKDSNSDINYIWYKGKKSSRRYLISNLDNGRCIAVSAPAKQLTTNLKKTMGMEIFIKSTGARLTAKTNNNDLHQYTITYKTYELIIESGELFIGKDEWIEIRDNISR